MTPYQPQPITYIFTVDYPPCGGCGRCVHCYSIHARAKARGWLAKGSSATRKYLTQPSFWLGTLLSFPIEHFIWEKIWPFDVLTKLLGL